MFVRFFLLFDGGSTFVGYLIPSLLKDSSGSIKPIAGDEGIELGDKYIK